MPVCTHAPMRRCVRWCMWAPQGCCPPHCRAGHMTQQRWVAGISAQGFDWVDRMCGGISPVCQSLMEMPSSMFRASHDTGMACLFSGYKEAGRPTAQLPCPQPPNFRPPMQVVGVLGSWAAQLHEAASLQSCLAQLAQLLGSRAEPAAQAAGPPSSPQVGSGPLF